MYQAIVIEKDDAGYRAELKSCDESELPEGDVTVNVEFSTLNYKDGLAITGKGPVVRKFPMVPGVDLVGTVADSEHPDFDVGDYVVLNGWGVGETHPGGLAQKARLNGKWLVPLEGEFTPRQAMAIGTAGSTAMLCVMALERGDLAGPAWLHSGRLDRARQRGRFPALARRGRSDRPCAVFRTRQAAGQGALGGRHRQYRQSYACQCVRDHALQRYGGVLRSGRRHGFPRHRRAFHSARRDTRGCGQRDGTQGAAARGVVTAGARSGHLQA